MSTWEAEQLELRTRVLERIDRLLADYDPQPASRDLLGVADRLEDFLVRLERRGLRGIGGTTWIKLNSIT